MGSIPSISPPPTEAAVPAPAHMQVGTEQDAGGHSRLRPSEAAQPLVQAATDAHCCQHCRVQTAQLISALVDANARVSTAREQLLAAQVDINMLIGKGTSLLNTAHSFSCPPPVTSHPFRQPYNSTTPGCVCDSMQPG
jgi:hypothetical protein